MSFHLSTKWLLRSEWPENRFFTWPLDFLHPSWLCTLDYQSYCNSRLSWYRSRYIHRRVASLAGADPLEPRSLSTSQELVRQQPWKSSSLPGIAAAMNPELRIDCRPNHCIPQSDYLHSFTSEVTCPQHACLWHLRAEFLAVRARLHKETGSCKR